VSGGRIKDELKANDMPMGLRSNIIYEYKCPDCKESYVKETYRQLQVRAYEHIGISWHTNKAVKTPGNSSIADHISDTGHNGNFEDFRILSPNWFGGEMARKILQAKFIRELKPRINGQNSGFVLKLEFQEERNKSQHKFPAWW